MITRHFTRAEFACRCGCGFADPHPYLVVGLERLRQIMNVPIHVLSGCRCFDHNHDIGGAAQSYHLSRDDFGGYGCAADVYAEGRPLADLVALVGCTEAFGGGGVGVYADTTPRVHLDVRGISGMESSATWAFIDGEPASVEDALRVDMTRRVTA